MYPRLFELNLIFAKLPVHTYGFLIAMGFVVGISLAQKEAKRFGYDPQFVFDLSFYIILGAIVGSRLYFVLTNLDHFMQNPLHVFRIWDGGLTFIGGFILAFGTTLWMIKKRGLRVWQTLDIFAPSLAIGVCFGRLGCFFAGCCYGMPCDLPWAVTFTHELTLARRDIPLHPTQLYSAAGALVTFLVLFLFRKRKTFDGQLALMWMFFYSFFRTINEQFRGDVRGDMLMGKYSVTLVTSVCVIVACLVLFPILKKKQGIAKR